MSSVDSWRRRPDRDTIAHVVRSARGSGTIDDSTRSIVFHDLDLLEARLAELTANFPSTALHTVAIKANPLVEILRIVVDAGHGLEAASYEELSLAMAAGCRPDRIVFDSPAKTRAELAGALELGVRLNADSLEELRRIEELRSTGSQSIVGIRINPLVGTGSIGTTSVAARDSKFGIPIDRVGPELKDMLRRHDWLRGLHVHVGSQGCTLDQLVAGTRAAVQLRDELRDELQIGLDQLDIGGGLPTDYDEATAAPTITEYAAALRNGVPGLFDGTTIVTEFGRALHAGCGWAATRVEYVKDDEPQTAVVHLGADFLVRPVYQPDFWRHRFTAIDHDAGEPESPWRLAGPLCFGGDIIGRGVPLPSLRPDDLVVIHDVGAYTLSMWSRHCSRGMPAVYGYRDTDAGLQLQLLRRAEEPADIVRLWSQ